MLLVALKQYETGTLFWACLILRTAGGYRLNACKSGTCMWNLLSSFRLRHFRPESLTEMAMQVRAATVARRKPRFRQIGTTLIHQLSTSTSIEAPIEIWACVLHQALQPEMETYGTRTTISGAYVIHGGGIHRVMTVCMQTQASPPALSPSRDCWLLIALFHLCTASPFPTSNKGHRFIKASSCWPDRTLLSVLDYAPP